MSDATPAANQFGIYQVYEKLGTGGMAIVYRAYNPESKRTVALKILRASVMEQPGIMERFKQEATIAQRLRHAHIVAVYNHGSVKGRYFLEMQYMPGGTLAQRFATPSEIHPQESIRLLRNVASALDYAHKQGVVHRDLKLENILLDERAGAALSDFSIARLMDGNRLTATGYVVGTPMYIAPEQARGETDADFRADLYSFAVIAYLLATGRFPFMGDNMMVVMGQHISEPVPPPSRVSPGLPAALDAVLLKALAKNPRERYTNADTFVEAFARAYADGNMSTQTRIDIRRTSEMRAAIKPLNSPKAETADSLYDKAVLVKEQDRFGAIQYLKKALELEPFHSKANRLLLQLEGAKPLNKPVKNPPAAPTPRVEDLAPLKTVKRQRGGGGTALLSLLALIVVAVSVLLVILGTRDPILLYTLTGRPPITAIEGTPVRDIPGVVLTVQPHESRPLAVGEQLQATIPVGIVQDYLATLTSSDVSILFQVNFVSQSVRGLTQYTAVIDPSGQPAGRRCQAQVADNQAGIRYTCRVDQAGTWRFRIFGVDGATVIPGIEAGQYLVYYGLS